MRNTILRVLLATATTALTVVPAATAHEPADQSDRTALITYELRDGRFHKLEHPVRVSVMRSLAAPTRAEKAAARARYRRDRHAFGVAEQLAYHYTCTHSTLFWNPQGGYHRYIGFGTYPWVHTHYYRYWGAAGIQFQYRTGPC